MKKSRKLNGIQGPYLAIEDWLWQTKLDAYYVLIIARILGFQRQNLIFYESAVELSNLFNCDRRVISSRLHKLTDLGILVKGSKHGRSSEYKVSINMLKAYVHQMHDQCTLNVQIEQNNVHEMYDQCASDAHYNNNKINNKINHIEEEEDVLASSSSHPEETISDEELKAFIEDLDI